MESRSRARMILLVAAISAAVLVPCFWHRHIEAGDLASHVYNAWLAQLAEQGKAAGVYVVWQWKNVLFDVVLFYLAKVFGLGAAEKIAVSLCVLIFFWGVFALVGAVTRRAPWFLTPAIGMLAYGFVFHMGFMNYYLSIGLACVGLAFLWEGKRNGLLGAAVIAPVTLLAHPLGLLLLVGVGGYRVLWLKLRGWLRWMLPISGVAMAAAARIFVSRHGQWETQWPEPPFYQWNGADQFMVFNARYGYIAWAMVGLGLLCAVVDVYRNRAAAGYWKERRMVLELYAVVFCATALLPENLQIDPTAGWIGFLASRLTLVSAIFGLCWLGWVRPARWQLAGFLGCSAVFFWFVYQDTGFLNGMEENADAITKTFAPVTRTLGTVFAPPDYRTPFPHVVDRACVGRCFLISNYEPSTRQFRVRVEKGSPVVTAIADESGDMESGVYEVEEDDLPLKEIYQCDGRDLARLCVRDLEAGELNGRLGYRPPGMEAAGQTP